MQNRDHWEQIYTENRATSVSWYQEHAEQSVRLVRETGVPRGAAILDVGGGASTLVDDLVGDGYTDVTVLDVSGRALEVAKSRLGDRAEQVRWLEADILTVALTRHAYDVWHDRAVFHFLTQAADRARYVAAVRRAVKPGGHVIVATFADDGPDQCSGLPVVRYSPDALHGQFGPAFSLLKHEREQHQTPTGSVQPFIYCYCRVAHPAEPDPGLLENEVSSAVPPDELGRTLSQAEEDEILGYGPGGV